MVSPNGNSTAQKWGYNGKEREQALGLNVIETDWRQYDPAIGRFNVVDAMAEMGSQLDKSPYAFAWNNPIFYGDPSGLCPTCPDGAKNGDTHMWGGQEFTFNDGQWSHSLDEVNITKERNLFGRIKALQTKGSAFATELSDANTKAQKIVHEAMAPHRESAMKTVRDLYTIQKDYLGGAGTGASLVSGMRLFNKVVSNVEKVNSAKLAKAWQGEGAYPGVDNWRNIILGDGKYVVGGLPGQSNYYTTLSGLSRSSLNKDKLFQGLQVSKHPQFGYRGSVGIYKVNGNTPAAFGTTYANPQFGAGGLPQIFIPDYSGLRLIKTIPLK